MMLFTDYPMAPNQPEGFVPVTVLSYDRNKYVTVQYAGHLHSIKRGYLRRNAQGDGYVSLLELYSLPTEVGLPRRTRRQAWWETKDTRPRHRRFELVVSTAQKSRQRMAFKQLKAALRKFEAVLRSGDYTSCHLECVTSRNTSWTFYNWMEAEGDQLHDYQIAPGPRGGSPLTRKAYGQMARAHKEGMAKR